MTDKSIRVLRWDASNDKLLKQYIDGLPQDRAIVLNVFGSRIVSEGAIIASLSWRDRASERVSGNVTVYIASALDVLVDNIKRLEDDHLHAFDLAMKGTGKIPSEDEMKSVLMNVVDMYRPPFPEELPFGDPVENTRYLWWHLYGHDIDVRKEIVLPAIRSRQKFLDEKSPDRYSILRILAT